MTPIRPKFLNPPLIERAVTVVFETIEAFTLGDYGLFWSEILAEFPVSEAVPTIPQELEQLDGFRPQQVRVQLLPENALPRAYFRNTEDGGLVQIQPDRFSFNWIKAHEGHRYPHSERVIERFFGLLDRFEAFIERRGYGAIVPIQCELTNVNVIPISDVGDRFSDVSTFVKLPTLSALTSLVELELQSVGSAHVMLDDARKAIGRVHSFAQPTLRASDQEPAYRLDIVARGAPLGQGREGVSQFFEAAVSAVNAVFLASVTDDARTFWGEQDG